jgi:hypothetical protein
MPDDISVANVSPAERKGGLADSCQNQGFAVQTLHFSRRCFARGETSCWFMTNNSCLASNQAFLKTALCCRTPHLSAAQGFALLLPFEKTAALRTSSSSLEFILPTDGQKNYLVAHGRASNPGHPEKIPGPWPRFLHPPSGPPTVGNWECAKMSVLPVLSVACVTKMEHNGALLMLCAYSVLPAGSVTVGDSPNSICAVQRVMEKSGRPCMDQIPADSPTKGERICSFIAIPIQGHTGYW